MNDQLYVLTPDKVVVNYRLASFGSRVGAYVCDLVVLFILGQVVTTITSFLMFVSFELAQAINIVIATFLLFFYFGLTEAFWKGQTLGKKLCSLRVMMADGTPVTPASAFYRNLVRLPPLFVVDLVCMFLNQKSQRIGDLVANTVVIHDPKFPANFTPAPHKYGLHPFEQSVGELKGMTLEDYYAIKRLCDRFPELPATTQVRSVEEIWQPFAETHGIDPLPNVHPVYQMEAVVMKYGRQHKLV